MEQAREKRNTFLKKGYKFKPYTKKEISKLEEDFEPAPPNWKNTEGLIHINHVILLKTNGDISDLNPFVLGEMQSDIIGDPSKMERGKEELVYLGNATVTDNGVFKDALKAVSSERFKPTSFQIITGSKKITVEKDDDFSFDFDDDDDLDEPSLDGFDDEKKVETFEIETPVPSEVIFYDDTNNTFRTTEIAPRVYDDDEKVKAMTDRYNSFMAIEDACTPEAVKRFDGLIKDEDIIPANVFFNDLYQPANLKNTDPLEFMKNYNKYKGTRIDEVKDGLENVIGYNVNCGSSIKDTKDCNKNFCFVPFSSGGKDGLLMTGKQVLRKVGRCLDAKEASSKLYPTKKAFKNKARLLSKFTGLTQKKIKEESTVCVLEPTKRQWSSDRYKAKMFKMGDQILGYEGERDFLLG